MKKFLLFSVVLLFTALGIVQAQDIPTSHKKSANQAFAQGYDYYIWYEGEEPLTPPSPQATALFGTMIPFSLSYYAKGEKGFIPFKIRINVLALNKDEKKSILYSTTSSQESSPKTRVGSELSLFAADKTKLSGEGYVEVFLFNPKIGTGDSQPQHLSNSILIRLNCSDKP